MSTAVYYASMAQQCVDMSNPPQKPAPASGWGGCSEESTPLQVLFGSQEGARNRCAVTLKQWKKDGAAYSAHRQALPGEVHRDLKRLVLLPSPATRASTTHSRITVQCSLPCTASSGLLSRSCATQSSSRLPAHDQAQFGGVVQQLRHRLVASLSKQLWATSGQHRSRAPCSPPCTAWSSPPDASTWSWCIPQRSGPGR